MDAKIKINAGDMIAMIVVICITKSMESRWLRCGCSMQSGARTVPKRRDHFPAPA